MADIKELKEVVRFIIEAYFATRQILDDDKVKLTDIAYVIPLIPKGFAAIEGAKNIPDEIKDLDADEAAELLAYVATAFGVSQEKAEPKLQKTFDIARAFRDLGE